MRLQALYFLPGVHVVTGVTNYPSSISEWRDEKYPLLKCEELKNGDITLTDPKGVIRTVHAHAIAYRVHVPDAVKPAEVVRPAVKS